MQLHARISTFNEEVALLLLSLLSHIANEMSSKVHATHYEVFTDNTKLREKIHNKDKTMNG